MRIRSRPACTPALIRVANPEGSRDFRQRLAGMPLRERGLAGDDEQARGPGKPGDEGVGKAFGEILVLAAGPRVGERQDSNRSPPFHRIIWSPRNRRVAPARCGRGRSVRPGIRRFRSPEDDVPCLGAIGKLITNGILSAADRPVLAQVLLSREALQPAGLPALHGCTAIFDGRRPLKMQVGKNHTSCRPCSENSGMDLFGASPGRAASMRTRGSKVLGRSNTSKATPWPFGRSPLPASVSLTMNSRNRSRRRDCANARP